MDDALSVGSIVELTIDRPVAGGRMLTRREGQVVLVAGAVPGERVRARIERIGRGVAFATTEQVLTASSVRRPATDPGCGGHAYAHIDYAAQPTLKRAVVLDALARGARIEWTGELPVHQSPEHGYRLRARLHVRNGRAGFFREGTHDLCDASTSRQLLEASSLAVQGLLARLPAAAIEALDTIELSENMTGDERAVHLAWRDRTRVGADWLGPHLAGAGITGVTVSGRDQAMPVPVAGASSVSDPLTSLLASLHGPPGVAGRLQRQPAAFFQANRFLIPGLVAAVCRHAGSGTIVDLYAGVGLFAVALAAQGRGPVIAVEGDPVSGMDLSANAQQVEAACRVERGAVEDFVRRLRLPPESTIIVDPPRAGMSRVALDGVLAARADRLVYVSCDVATLARDLKRALDAGYTLSHLEAFDLFPNTAHVETLAVLERQDRV